MRGGGRTWPCVLGEPGQWQEESIYFCVALSEAAWAFVCGVQVIRSDQYSIHSSGCLNNDCFVLLLFLSFLTFSAQIVWRQLSAIISGIYFWWYTQKDKEKKNGVERTFYLASQREQLLSTHVWQLAVDTGPRKEDKLEFLFSLNNLKHPMGNFVILLVLWHVCVTNK